MELPPPIRLADEAKRRLNRLLEVHGPALTEKARKMCRTREEAEDLVGDVRLYAAANSGKILQHPNPRAWLFKVMGSRYIDYCRSKKPCPLEQGHLATLGREDQRIARWHAHQALRMAIQALPDRLAVVCRLRLEGHELRVIAERVGVSTAEAGRLLGRAYSQLNDFFTRDLS